MGNVGQIRHTEIDKRRYTAILLLCIYSTQVSVAAIIENLDLVTSHFLAWNIFYYIIALLSIIPQAGLSDDAGRKKHLLIASSCVFVAVLVLLITIISKKTNSVQNTSLSTFITLLSICSLLGLAGNAIPIARGCLSSIKVHDFRSAIGITSVCIGLGWATTNALGFIISRLEIIFFSAVLQLVVILCIKYFYEFEEHVYIRKKKFYLIIKESYKWCGTMLLVAGGAAAIGAYLLTETSFYQLFVLPELPEATIGKKIISLLMVFAYLSGVMMQWIVYPSDKNSIKFGALFSFFFLMLFVAFHVITKFSDIPQTNYLKITGSLQFFFAFGFGFSVPALFSLMSEKIHPHHIGRLFGAVDVTDITALGCSSVLLFLKNKVSLGNCGDLIRYSILLILFSFSLILYRKFIKLFTSYERNHD